MLSKITSPFILTFLTISATFIFLFSGCSATEQTTEQQPQQQSPQSVDRQHQNHAEMERVYWERIEQSRMHFTQADVDFMTGMIGHHAQALIMSRLAPENGAGSSIQTLASRIINAQSDEIYLMQRWLRDRGQPVPMVNIDGLILTIEMEMPEDGDHDMPMDHDDHDAHADMDHEEMDHGMGMMHDHSDMPGMLTQEQLEELAAARGKEFDRLFLTFMIEHHQGAVIMVEELFSADGAASDTESFELASGINAEQVTEIERMKLMLDNIE